MPSTETCCALPEGAHHSAQPVRADQERGFQLGGSARMQQLPGSASVAFGSAPACMRLVMNIFATMQLLEAASQQRPALGIAGIMAAGYRNTAPGATRTLIC